MQEKNVVDLSHVLHPENQHETVAIVRGLCPFAEEATDALLLVCCAMVEARGDKKVVSEYLGWSVSRISAMLQSRLADRVIKKLSRNKINGLGYLIATSTLMDIASSESQTGNARVNASKTIIELSDQDDEKIGGMDNEKDLNAMTLLELEAFVNSIKQDLVKIRPENDMQAIDGVALLSSSKEG